MTVFRAVSVLAVLFISVVLALLARRGVHARITGLFSMISAALMLVLIPAKGGTLYEVLLGLILPLWLLMPKEKAS